MVEINSSLPAIPQISPSLDQKKEKRISLDGIKDMYISSQNASPSKKLGITAAIGAGIGFIYSLIRKTPVKLTRVETIVTAALVGIGITGITKLIKTDNKADKPKETANI